MRSWIAYANEANNVNKDSPIVLANHLRVNQSRLVFTSHGVRVLVGVVRALMTYWKSKKRSRKRNHKLDGIGVGRIRTFRFSSDSAYDSVAYDPVKTDYYALNSLSLFWFAESVRWIFEISARDVITADYTIERFSFERRKVIGFAFTTLRDWLKKLAPIFHPIRSKTKTIRDSLAHVFPRFASATRNYF